MIVRRSLLLVALASLLTACTSRVDPGDEGAQESDFASVPDCRGFDMKATIERTHDLSPDYQCQVSEALSRSSQPDERWIKSLSDPATRQRPFRAVVNLRGENGANGEDPIVRRYGMRPLSIPVLDKHAPTREQVVTFLSFATTRENQPLLVHCKAGQGRTGTFVATYRMAVQGWAPADAIAEARSFNVNDEQTAFLADFSTHLGDPEIARFRE